MLFLSENLKRNRILKNLTQEEVADYLNVTPQSVSKWERGESYPDITFLPALANIFETSIDALIGMDIIRAEETIYYIHKTAGDFQRDGNNAAAEKVYRDALLIYPNKPGMMLGLAGALALQGKCEEAIELMEKGHRFPSAKNKKQHLVRFSAFYILNAEKRKKQMRLQQHCPIQGKAVKSYSR